MSSELSESTPMVSAPDDSRPSWLESPWAPLLTHISVAVMTVAMFLLLLYLPFWFVFIPCALLHHRVGILVHEYIHGIPFQKYRHNHWAVTFFDGLLLAFGFLELFRSTHLLHHKWLNSAKDPAFQSAHAQGPKNPFLNAIYATETCQHLLYLIAAVRGENPIIKVRHFIYGVVLSSVHTAAWVIAGRPEMALYLIVLSLFTTLVSSSLRGAIEHHSVSGDLHSTNEYRSFLPIFNMNRHVHHHDDPTVPWYRLKYLTDRVLPARTFITHWFHVYIRKDFVMMAPHRQK